MCRGNSLKCANPGAQHKKTKRENGNEAKVALESVNRDIEKRCSCLHALTLNIGLFPVLARYLLSSSWLLVELLCGAPSLSWCMRYESSFGPIQVCDILIAQEHHQGILDVAVGFRDLRYVMKNEDGM